MVFMPDFVILSNFIMYFLFKYYLAIKKNFFIFLHIAIAYL